MPLASAIVLCYHEPVDALKCTEALLKQTIADRLEIFVVDNGSNDDTVGRLENTLPKDNRVRLLEIPKNIGYGKGNNFGAQYATGEYIMIINPDNILEPDGLEQMINHLKENNDVGIVGPKLVHPDGSIRPSFRAFPSMIDIFIKRTFLKRWFQQRMDAYLRSRETPTEPTNVDWIAGACLVLKRDLFNQLEGFDKRFYLFFEDTDLCRRIWNMGKRVVYMPNVQALDKPQRLSAGGFLKVLTSPNGRTHIASAVKYFWKWKMGQNSKK